MATRFANVIVERTDPYYYLHNYARVLNNTVDSRTLRKTCKRLGLPSRLARTWSRSDLRAYVKRRTPKFVRTIFSHVGAKKRATLLTLCEERDRVNGAAPLAFYKASKRYIRSLSASDRRLLYRHTIAPLRPGPALRRLNRVLQNAPRLTHDLVVFRGMRLSRPTQIATQKHDRIQSLSFGPEFSLRFAGSTCCLLVLTLPKGTPALSLTPLMHQVSFEDELLVPIETSWELDTTHAKQRAWGKRVLRGTVRNKS